MLKLVTYWLHANNIHKVAVFHKSSVHSQMILYWLPGRPSIGDITHRAQVSIVERLRNNARKCKTTS